MNRMQAVHILCAYNKVMDKGKIFWPEQLERWSEKLGERTGNQGFNFRQVNFELGSCIITLPSQ